MYKTLNYNNYNYNDVDKFDKSLEMIKQSQTKNIDTKIMNDEFYISYENIKFKNLLDDFDNTYGTVYTLKNNGSETSTIFMIGTGNQSFTSLFFENYNAVNNSDENYQIDMKELFNEKGIVDDVTLFKYIIELEKEEINVLTNAEEMKENYSLKKGIAELINTFEDITFIDGDLYGFILEMENTREVHLLEEDKMYTLSFVNDEYWNDEKIYEILDTLVIE